MPIFCKGNFYEKISFRMESEFEEQVSILADQLFGVKSIYLSLKKKIKGNNIGVIPDGYLIDMTISEEPKLYVVENEIVNHDPFKHIGIQMLKFVTSFEEERVKIKNLIMAEISKEQKHLQRLEQGCRASNSRNIDNYLDKAVFSKFQGLVIIDEAKGELHKVLEKINANISVLELKTYKTADNSLAYEFDTLYEEDEEVTPIEQIESQVTSNEERMRRHERRAASDTIVVPAREEGFKEEFLKNNQWYAIRIGAAMKERIKYIAAYQVAPISAVTHVAKVKEIRPYKDTGKYIVLFDGPAVEIEHKKIVESGKSPQGPVYVKYNRLIESKTLSEAFDLD